MVTKKKNLSQPTCPVSYTVKVIGGKWKPPILFFLINEKRRFNELQRLIGNPSARILTAQLRELEDDKIIKREVYDQIPPKVEYSLTPKGKSLIGLLDAMAKWGTEHHELKTKSVTI